MKKDTPKNKICWAKGCNKEQLPDSWYCKKHDGEEYVQAGVPEAGGHNPNIPK